MRWLTSSIFLLLFVSFSTIAQDERGNIISAPNRTWEVYVQNDIAGDMDLLLFVDILDATAETVQTTGERYTTLDDSVLFYNPASRTMLMATPDGNIRPHPFVQINDAARRIDWVLSDDQRNIAWTLTYGSGDNMRTETWVAGITGTDQRLVLEDGPRNDGVRALPVAFSTDNTGLIMDAHPDIVGDFGPYTLYATLFELNLADGEITVLPGENRPCFCGAGVKSGAFLRLSITSDLQGFNIKQINLNTEDVRIIDAISLPNFTQAGDVLISPDATQAIYALSQIENFGSTRQSTNTIFVLVDLVNGTQRQLNFAITNFVRPIRWTDDNLAVLFTSPDRSGTWKMRLSDAELIRVAESSFIGTIRTRIA